MRLLVCGGREFVYRPAVFAALDRAHAKRTVTVLVHGAARGADSLAGEWARARGIAEERHPANWERDGKRAGPIRNAEMLATGIDGVVAFPGGRGTAHMVQIAREAGVPVWQPLAQR
jgi:hypothetical protein